jgi:hypothetical protein
MIHFSKQDEEKIIKVLWVYDGDVDVIDEIHKYGNKWVSLSSFLIEDTLVGLKDHLRREYSHLN